MALQLRKLSEDVILIPSTTRHPTIPCNPTSGDPIPSLGLLGHLHAHDIYKLKQAHKINKFLNVCIMCIHTNFAVLCLHTNTH